jgi:hypothetical protein
MEQKSSHSTRIPTCGSISFGRSKADCLIRSISAYGAALDIAGDEKIPDKFALIVIPDVAVQSSGVKKNVSPSHSIESHQLMRMQVKDLRAISAPGAFSNRSCVH